jgi:magnesium transporter
VEQESTTRTCLARIGDEVRRLRGPELEQIDRLRLQPGTLVWLDIVHPDDEDLELLAKEFGVHPLAIEDVHNRGQRPKLETYADQYVVVAYEALPDGLNGLRLGELHLFAGDGYVVTVHWDASPAIDATRDRFERRAEAVGTTVGRLKYAILDAVVDGYFPVVDQLNERIEQLEDRVLAGGQGSDTLRDVLALKRQMLELRRVLAPLRDVANGLLRRDIPLIDDETLPYYRDLYDHLVRVLDSLDLFRDLVAATLDANLAVTSNTLNAVMKRLTAFTVVLMVPTLIAGIYGMNYMLLPDGDWPYGFVFALAAMAVAGVMAVSYFRRKGWF